MAYDIAHYNRKSTPSVGPVSDSSHCTLINENRLLLSSRWRQSTVLGNRDESYRRCLRQFKHACVNHEQNAEFHSMQPENEDARP